MSPPDRPPHRSPRPGRWDSVLTILVSAVVSFVVLLLVLELMDRAPVTEAPEARPRPAQEPDEIARPSPLPPLEVYPAGSPVRITIRDASARTRDGQTVDVPEASLIVELGDEPGEPLLRVLRAIVRQPVITVPPRAAAAPEGPPQAAGPGAVAALAGLDLPHIVVESLIIEGGVLGEPAPAGTQPGWTYLWEDIDLVIRDVIIGGDGTQRFAFDLSLDGRLGGQPVRLESVRGAARRGGVPGDSGAIEFEGEVRLGESLVMARGIARPDGTVQLEVQADTLDFPGLSGFLAIIPEEGGGAGTVRITRTPERTVVELVEAQANVAGYQLRASGVAIATEEVIELDARLTRTGTAGESRMLVRGTVEPGEIPRLDLTVDAVPVIFADSLFTGRLLVQGPTDSLAVRGALALNRTGTLSEGPDQPDTILAAIAAIPDSLPSGRQPLIALVDAIVTGVEENAPRAAGTVDIIADPGAMGLTAGAPIRAQVTGDAALSPQGELAAEMTLDTLPLALVPFPAGVADVRGHATGGLRVTGTLDAPVLEGSLRLDDGGALITDPGVEITELQGDVRLAGDVITVDGLSARAGGGELLLGGTVDLNGPLDLSARADSVQLLNEPDAQLRLDAALTLSGTADAPVVRGNARPQGWIHESFLESDPGLDLDDPPYVDLAARAPWPEASRLRAASAANNSRGQDRVAPEPVAPDTALVPDSARAGVLPPPTDTTPSPADALDLQVTVDVTQDFQIIDEDSELRGEGPLLARMEGDDLTVEGVLSLEQGFYQSFGARFEIAGGAIIFDGIDLEPRVAVRAEYQDDAPLVGDNEALTAPERFPPIEFFGFGSVSNTVQEMRRSTLVPWGQLDLAGLLLLDEEPQPVTGWRHPRFWRSDEGPELVAERAETQLVPLLWSYLADEAYDFLPLSTGYLRAGIVTVGSRYPSRVVVGPILRAAGVLGPALELRLSQPFLGSVGPGAALVYRWRGLWLESFSEPRFHAAPALGPDHPGYEARRRTGIGVRWSSDR